MLTLVRQRALQYKAEYRFRAVLHFCLFFTFNSFTLKLRIIITIIVEIYGKGKIRLVLQYGSIYQHFSFFGNGYLFNIFFIVQNSAVQYP